MSFISKLWKDRVSEYPTRRALTDETGEQSIVTVTREEGVISQTGDAFSAANMNDLETRIENAFEESNTALEQLRTQVDTDVAQQIQQIQTNFQQQVTQLNNSLTEYKSLTLNETSPVAVVEYLRQNTSKDEANLRGIEFNYVVNNMDYFSGKFYCDRANLYWGIIQQRTGSASDSTIYKFMGNYNQQASTDTVIPFSKMTMSDNELQNSLAAKADNTTVNAIQNSLALIKPNDSEIRTPNAYVGLVENEEGGNICVFSHDKLTLFEIDVFNGVPRCIKYTRNSASDDFKVYSAYEFEKMFELANNTIKYLPNNASTNLLTDALNIDLRNPLGVANRTGYVQKTQTIAMPSGCHHGVREVLCYDNSPSNNYVFVRITGYGTDGLFHIWINEYQNGDWKGWN